MNQTSNHISNDDTYNKIDESSNSHEGAATLAASINDNKFQLVYQAREESVGGSKLRMAKNIVDFAKSYRCGYVLVIDGSCWISPDKGTSLLAQIEGNEKLDKYEYVVLPLDHAVYIAKINESIVVEEHVKPTDQAINFLQSEQNAEIAILAGGYAYEKLASQQYIVNCDLTLFTFESESLKFSFKAINRALIANRLYHPRLFIPAVVTILPLLIIAFLFSPFYNVGNTRTELDHDNAFLDLNVKSETAPVIQAPSVPQINLQNNASQIFRAIRPWVTGKSINFLRTCRLKTIAITKNHLAFVGERMSNIKKNQLGCGNSRLNEISQANKLKVTREQSTWQIDVRLEPSPGQSSERIDYIETIERLELLSQHIGWRLNILPTINDNKQHLKILFQGKEFSSQVLTVLSQGLSNYAAEFIKGSLQFNPNNLDLLDAQFEIEIYTKSSQNL